MNYCFKVLGTCAVALLLASPIAHAQGPGRDTTAIPDNHLFVKRDLAILGGFAAGTIAMFPLDRRIAGELRDSSLVGNENLEAAANVIGFLGSYGPFLIGGSMFVVGKLADKPRLTHLAVHGTEAIVVGLVVTGALKVALGRSRPWVSADTNPRDFGFLRGFRGDGYQAFPSGHTTTSFAVAAAVTAEMHEWHPRYTWIVAPLLYGGATLAGLSRMYEDKHWASDVVMGAAIGTFAGLKTVRFTHTRTGNRIDRWLLGDDAQLGMRISPGVEGSTLFLVSARW